MKLSLQETEKIFLKEDLVFKSLALSMLVTRLKVLHARSPSEYTLESCNDAINTFLERFRESMLEDYEIIAKL